MISATSYKGYDFRVEFDGRDGIFVGCVLGLDDKVSFHGATHDELFRNFRAAVDHYLEACRVRGAETGIDPKAGA